MNMEWYRITTKNEVTKIECEEGNEDNEPSLEAIQEAVGGYFRPVPTWMFANNGDANPYVFTCGEDIFQGKVEQIYCNEDGDAMRLPFSPATVMTYPNHLLVGDVLIGMIDVTKISVSKEVDF